MFFGSYGRKTHDFYSDLDLFIYLNNSSEFEKEKEKEKEIKNEILSILNDLNEETLLDFNIYDKWIFFLKQNLIKIDIGIKPVSKAKEDVIFIVESRINSPEQAIVFDRNSEILQIYKSNWIQLDEEKRLQNIYRDDVHKFIYYYNNFIRSLTKDDEYKAYMNYTIAFYKLVGLKTLVEGKYFNLYQPQRFTTEILKDWSLRKKFYRASAGLKKYDMFNQRENFLSLFLEVIEKGKQRFNSVIDISGILKYFEITNNRYPPFKNLRDISLLPNIFSNRIKIREGLIYRSASLSKSDPDLILKFLKKKKIKYILDLRGENELKNYIKYNNFYNDDLKTNTVINIPLEPEFDIYMPDKPHENFYYGILKNYRSKIKEVFEKYFVNAPENKLIIHCEGGKDRTGVMIAILLDLLNIEREIIISDYLLSYSDTKRRYIDFLLNTLDNDYGGSEKFLINHCNVSNEAIKKIKNILVKNN